MSLAAPAALPTTHRPSRIAYWLPPCHSRCRQMEMEMETEMMASEAVVTRTANRSVCNPQRPPHRTLRTLATWPSSWRKTSPGPRHAEMETGMGSGSRKEMEMEMEMGTEMMASEAVAANT